MIMNKVFYKFLSVLLAVTFMLGVVPRAFAAEDSVIASIDFEDAKNAIGNVTGKTAVGDMNYTIIPANAGNPEYRAKVKVATLADQEKLYPGVNDSRMGNKALLFERSGSRSCMTRWTDVYNMSDTVIGETYRVSLWVYTADVVEAGSKEGESVVRFFVSKGGAYGSSDPASTKEQILHKSVPNGVWTELAFEFEMTKAIQDAGANSFRLDSNGTEGSYAQTIFIDNFKLEKAGTGSSLSSGQTNAGTANTNNTPQQNTSNNNGSAAQTLSSIDFENAKNAIGNVTGKTAVGDMNYTIIPANAGNPEYRAKVKVATLADQEKLYPGVNDSRMGNKALLFERSGSRSCMTRWTDVYNMSDTVIGETYRVSLWVYTADVVEAGSKEGESVVRFFVSKGGAYGSGDPASKTEQILHKSVPNGVWTELAFEFEMTKAIQDAGANSFRLDSNGTEGSYAQTIFIDNFKLEKAGAGSSQNTPQTNTTSNQPGNVDSEFKEFADYDKIEGKSYETAVKVLHSLGIVSGDDKGNFDPERKLTRAEILAVILRVLGNRSAGYASNVEFSDVSSTHWAKDIISSGVAFGIINGYDDGTFRPDAEVSGAEAIKMLVSAIGYENMAEMEGGYPDGYIAIAGTLQLLAKTNVKADSSILRWQCAQMVYNSLEVKLQELTYESGAFGSTTSDDKTVLSEYHDAEIIKGTLTAVPNASIDKDKKVTDGYVSVDGVTYECKLNLDDLLGKHCVFYIKETSFGDWEVVCAYESSRNDDTVEIKTEDIISITATSEDSLVVEYEVTPRAETYKFEGGNIIYNNEEVTFASQNEFQTFLDNNVKQGMIRVVETDSKDTLFIENYNVYVVNRVSALSEKIFYVIYGKDVNGQGELPLSGVDYKLYEANGTPIELEDLEVEDVISVYKNSTGDKLSIYRSKTKVSGKLENMEYISGEGPYDWQPPVTSIKFVQKITDYSDWTLAGSDTASMTFKQGEQRVIPMKNGGNTAAPSPYTTADFSGEIISYEDMISATKGEYTYGTDTVVDSLFYDEAGKLKTGKGIKTTVDASLQMVRYNNMFGPVTPGTPEEPANIKVRLAVYMTDIQDKQGQPDDDNSVNSIPIRIALRTSANADVEYKDFTVPVNKWHIIESEWTLNGNVADIHGVRLNLSCGHGGSSTTPYTTPYAKTIYHSGQFEVWMDDEVTETPEMPEETCIYRATVDGQKYYIADSLPDGLLFWSPMGVGSTATFLIDHEGRIAGYIAKNTASENYGLLMAAAAENGGDPGVVKILTSKGKLETFECEETIRGFDGTAIVKQPLSYFISNEPADPKKSHYIWSTDNSSNFCMTPKTWLDERSKSNAASRKIVYYKTNEKGKITEILVPSMPLAMKASKIKMLRDFTEVSATSSYGTLLYRKGYDYLVTSNQEVTPIDELQSYRISDDVLVYYVNPNEFSNEDYKLSSFESLPDNSYLMQVYSFSDDETADAVVICPQNKYPSLATSVMFDFFDMNEDGSYTLHGYSKGEKFSCKVPDNLRINERLWYIDDKYKNKLTRDNVLEAKEMGVKPYQSTYERDGMETPYVFEAGLKRGDILGVDVSNGTAVNVEVVSRIDDGIGLSRNLHIGTDVGSMLDQGVTTKVGTVEEISDDGEYVKLKAYVWSVSGFIVSGILNNQASSTIQPLELWYHVADLPVTIRDEKTNNTYTGNIGDIEPGDEIIILGKVQKPTGVYVWKNAK